MAEDQAILRSGLATAPYISVDGTGARHARRDEVTPQIGGTRFSVFRTGCSKSRLNFLSLLWAACEDYVIDDAALDYMRQRKVAPAPDVIGELAAHPETLFASQTAWYDYLVRLGMDVASARSGRRFWNTVSASSSAIRTRSSFLDPAHKDKVCFAPNLSFDFSPIKLQNMTLAQAEGKWAAEFDQITGQDRPHHPIPMARSWCDELGEQRLCRADFHKLHCPRLSKRHRSRDRL